MAGIADRALVLGGSMAGLLAAHVLADAYREVVVVDRDQLVGVTGLRRTTPQCFHAHALLARGQQAIEELFPGITKEFEADGVPVGDIGSDLRWVLNGQRLYPTRTGLVCLATPRVVLEARVREKVAALPNVTMLEYHDVLGLTSTRGGTRVTGARVSTRSGQTQTVEADLVVDTTGRGSRLPVWLAELGYQRPVEEKMKIGLGYATRHYRMPEGLLGTDIAYIVAQTPSHPRGAVLARQRRLPDGGDRYVLSLNAHLGDHPPTTPEGFLAYARTVPVPHIYESIRGAEPLDDIQAYKFPTTQWRHYEALERFPAGLLVMGDSLASPNPVYAQGNTITALQALALRQLLRTSADPRPRDYFAAVGPIIAAVWEMNATGDLGYKAMPGHRTPKTRIAAAYLTRLQHAAVHDAVLSEAFLRVAGLIDPVPALLRPGHLLRVLRQPRSRPLARRH